MFSVFMLSRSRLAALALVPSALFLIETACSRVPLTAPSGSSITLKRAENQTDVVLRKDIDEIASTGVSLMPEGILEGLEEGRAADLVRFLMTP